MSTGVLTIHTRYYTLDDVHDGDVTPTDENEQEHRDLTPAEAAELLVTTGLCGQYALSVHPVQLDQLTGHEWFCLPDGSVIADTWDAHYTGLLMERTGHLSGWSVQDFRSIVFAALTA
ncbi:hypothetical protein GCM10010411_76340 [Actinomadura fulvescens]|uniref:Uncharacterized protein n=1 Tax=Actinomadura fulvescens TaxID=46160 RepID=A0ABP6CYN8_9ACTN